MLHLNNIGSKNIGIFFITGYVFLIITCSLLIYNTYNVWSRYFSENPMKIENSKSRLSDSKRATKEIKDNPVNIQDIIQQNIFGGNPENNEEKKKIDLEKIPLVKELEDFKLIGTIVSSSLGNQAIIENRSKNKQEIYRIGDSLQDARIKEILRNNVVLAYKNKDKVMSIDYKSRQKLHEQSDLEKQKKQEEAQENPFQRAITSDKNPFKEAISNHLKGKNPFKPSNSN